MEHSTLNNLITYMEYGTKLHIGVLFLGNYGNEKLQLPFNNTIHSSTVCKELKSLPQGYRRCYKCRNMAIQKAIDTKKAFGGCCINGVYEYTRPVVINDNVVCIIFIGNILPEGKKKKSLEQLLLSNAELSETMEKNFGYEKCEAAGSVIESYIKMIMELFPLPSNDKFSPVIENLKKYIEENLEYKIDLSLLAGIFHYNEKYLGRLFKQKTGKSICEYIALRRIDRAKTLLRQSKDSVISISEKTGFNNVTYFNRLFKKHFNVTPIQYRKNGM